MGVKVRKAVFPVAGLGSREDLPLQLGLGRLDLTGYVDHGAGEDGEGGVSLVVARVHESPPVLAVSSLSLVNQTVSGVSTAGGWHAPQVQGAFGSLPRRYHLTLRQAKQASGGPGGLASMLEVAE